MFLWWHSVICQRYERSHFSSAIYHPCNRKFDKLGTCHTLTSWLRPPLFRCRDIQMYAQCGLCQWQRYETGCVCDVSYLHVASNFTINVKKKATPSSDMLATRLLERGTYTQEQHQRKILNPRDSFNSLYIL